MNMGLSTIDQVPLTSYLSFQLETLFKRFKRSYYGFTKVTDKFRKSTGMSSGGI